MIQRKPPVNTLVQKFEFYWKTTCMDKITSNSNSIFVGKCQVFTQLVTNFWPIKVAPYWLFHISCIAVSIPTCLDNWVPTVQSYVNIIQFWALATWLLTGNSKNCIIHTCIILQKQFGNFQLPIVSCPMQSSTIANKEVSMWGSSTFVAIHIGFFLL